MQNTETLTQLEKDVIDGLSTKPKSLPSKYFYDDKGSQIFQKIMKMPEYYLSDCELEIFNIHKKQISNYFNPDNNLFDIIELGAGDGTKTKVLLKYLLENGSRFKYIPIDISEKAVHYLTTNLNNTFPNLNIEERAGDYFEMMEDINRFDKNPKHILFLGSNIGNYSISESIDFFRKIADVMNAADQLFIGFDLVKAPSVILNAYNDKQGYTRNFNLNLLERINNELEADFNLEKFDHYPVYDPDAATAKSYLVSTSKQEVYIRSLDAYFHFNKWESIYTEMSQKYNLELINEIAEKSGFKIIDNFFDSRHYYVNSLWKLNNK